MVSMNHLRFSRQEYVVPATRRLERSWLSDGFVACRVGSFGQQGPPGSVQPFGNSIGASISVAAWVALPGFATAALDLSPLTARIIRCNLRNAFNRAPARMQTNG
jgi:hypothetical protein